MSIDKYFNENGYLNSAVSNYKFRQAQIEAAQTIEKAFNDYSNAVIEAPTGSGKTFAYLIPAFESGRKIIISTKTKQLMSQLAYKDILTVENVFQSKRTVNVLKGRKNYFCPRRFFKLIMPNGVYFADAVVWFEKNAEAGIIEAPWNELDNETCSSMTADTYQCSGSKCVYFSDCPFYNERTKANASDIIITNHHLVLSDIALKAKNAPSGIFEFRDHAIFDEAHSVADIYSQYAGTELSLFGLMSFFKENKVIFPLLTIDKISKMYFDILNSVREDRVLYDCVRGNVEALIELGLDAVSHIDDEDIRNEYARYTEALIEIEEGQDGLRYAEKSDHRLSVKLIPFESGESFAEGIKRLVLSSVFISATLSSGGNFEYFINETGLDKNNVSSKILPPVFDFKKQAKLYVPTSKELYNKDELYKELVFDFEGSCLIICNSVERMKILAEKLSNVSKKKNIFMQGNVTIGKLDTSEDMVLIGCASLREGIDLSGKGFKCVILDKLPFEFFKDFLLQSKADRLEKENKNSFTYFFLPRAVLYFKQAIGRLIRHEDDVGLWAVFDDRILAKNYGKHFLNVLENAEKIKDKTEALKYLKGV